MVSQVDPIRAYFSISEQEYLKVSGLANSGRGGDWMKAASATQLKLVLADGSIYAHTGRIYFTDRQVDAKTGHHPNRRDFPQSQATFSGPASLDGSAPSRKPCAAP